MLLSCTLPRCALAIAIANVACNAFVQTPPESPHEEVMASASISIAADDDATLSAEIDVDAEPPTQPLLLPGRKFPLDFAGGELTINATPLVLHERSNASAGTGFTIWDGAVVMAKFLEHHAADLVVGRTVLEVGSGTGLGAIAAGFLGARHVFCTDLAYALDLAKENVRRNLPSIAGSIQTKELDWTQPYESGIDFTEVDVVVGADVIWLPELVQPLVTTLAAMHAAAARRRDHATRPLVTYISHQTRARATDRLFHDALAAAGLHVSVLPRREHHPRFVHADIDIFRIESEPVVAATDIDAADAS